MEGERESKRAAGGGGGGRNERWNGKWERMEGEKRLRGAERMDRGGGV